MVSVHPNYVAFAATWQHPADANKGRATTDVSSRLMSEKNCSIYGGGVTSCLESMARAGWFGTAPGLRKGRQRPPVSTIGCRRMPHAIEGGFVGNAL